MKLYLLKNNSLFKQIKVNNIVRQLEILTTLTSNIYGNMLSCVARTGILKKFKVLGQLLFRIDFVQFLVKQQTIIIWINQRQRVASICTKDGTIIFSFLLYIGSVSIGFLSR